MILWTIQSLERLGRLLQNGELESRRMDETFSPIAYRYVRSELTKLQDPPSSDSWPLWAWFQYDGERQPMPDVTLPGHIEPGSEGALIEFEIPEENCLLSDFILYHDVMNLQPTFFSDREQETFEQKLKDAGIWFGDARNILSHEKFGPQVISSWRRIFDLDSVTERTLARSERSIQAVFWKLQLSQVRKVTRFIGAENDF